MVTLQIPCVGLASNNMTYLVPTTVQKHEICPFMETGHLPVHMHHCQSTNTFHTEREVDPRTDPAEQVT